jgi:hypothetical protein
MLNKTLVIVTNTNHGLLYTYRAIKQTAYRKAELSKDIVQNQFDLERLFAQETVYRLVSGNVDRIAQHRTALLAVYGQLFYESLGT